MLLLICGPEINLIMIYYYLSDWNISSFKPLCAIFLATIPLFICGPETTLYIIKENIKQEIIYKWLFLFWSLLLVKVFIALFPWWCVCFNIFLVLLRKIVLSWLLIATLDIWIQIIVLELKFCSSCYNLAQGVDTWILILLYVGSSGYNVRTKLLLQELFECAEI